MEAVTLAANVAQGGEGEMNFHSWRGRDCLVDRIEGRARIIGQARRRRRRRRQILLTGQVLNASWYRNVGRRKQKSRTSTVGTGTSDGDKSGEGKGKKNAAIKAAVR